MRALRVANHGKCPEKCAAKVAAVYVAYISRSLLCAESARQRWLQYM